MLSQIYSPRPPESNVQTPAEPRSPASPQHKPPRDQRCSARATPVALLAGCAAQAPCPFDPFPTALVLPLPCCSRTSLLTWLGNHIHNQTNTMLPTVLSDATGTDKHPFDQGLAFPVAPRRENSMCACLAVLLVSRARSQFFYCLGLPQLLGTLSTCYLPIVRASTSTFDTDARDGLVEAGPHIIFDPFLSFPDLTKREQSKYHFFATHKI